METLPIIFICFNHKKGGFCTRLAKDSNRLTFSHKQTNYFATADIEATLCTHIHTHSKKHTNTLECAKPCEMTLKTMNWFLRRMKNGPIITAIRLVHYGLNLMGCGQNIIGFKTFSCLNAKILKAKLFYN